MLIVVFEKPTWRLQLINAAWLIIQFAWNDPPFQFNIIAPILKEWDGVLSFCQELEPTLGDTGVIGIMMGRKGKVVAD